MVPRSARRTSDPGTPRRRTQHHIAASVASDIFVVATALINALNVFDPIVVMTQGGPNDSTQTLVKYIVDNAVQFFQIGYASAIAAVTFLLVLALTLGQNGLQRVWVHYE